MRFLITGGAGFLGCHTAEALADVGHQVVAADDFSRGSDDGAIAALAARENVSLHRANLLLPAAWNSLTGKFDCVIHFAAINGTRHFYERPYEVLDVNISLVTEMLRWHRRSGQRGRIVFTSSSETYAGTSGVPVPTPETVVLTVEDMSNPRWSYATSKIAGESLVTNYGRTSGAPYVVIRPHNIYGPRMGNDHVIPEFAARIAKKEDPFVINGGENTRAFCFVRDFVRGTVLAAITGRADGQVINVGDDREEVRISDLAKLMFSVAGVSPKVVVRPAPAGSVVRRCPDISRARRLLGYEPQVNLREGVEATFKWYARQVQGTVA
jgi:UDP-glucose 4-epimerase/UDP-glucuronate decarboxylase